MVRNLQKKFIMTAMLAITILLVVLIAGINILNFIVTDRNQKELLERVCTQRGRLMQEDDRDQGIFGRKDLQRTSAFAVVYLDESGQVTRTDLSHIFEMEEEEARKLALEAYALEDREGRLEGFLYRKEDLSQLESERPLPEGEAPEDFAQGPPDFPAQETTGTVLVLLDVASQRGNLMSFLLISVGIALVCLAAMILPVRLLSHYMIRPIAENIQRQKEFVTNAGHEIKTPLAIIQANADALELFQGESKWTRNIKAQTLRLSGLMQNLLTLSRMDETGLNLAMEAFDLSAALSESWKPFADPAAVRKLGVTLEIEEGVRVTGNRDSIQQLFSILFDNALKYTPEGGEIRISLERDSRYALVRASNSCRPDQMPSDPSRLFDRFYREDKARNQKAGGYGIGLSAAMAIAKANHASLSAAAVSADVVEFSFRI